MHGGHVRDFHSLIVVDGRLIYEWSCGTGVGRAIVAVTTRVDDGKWHEAKIVRRGRQTKLVLDKVHSATAASPAGSDVINLYGDAEM